METTVVLISEIAMDDLASQYRTLFNTLKATTFQTAHSFHGRIYWHDDGGRQHHYSVNYRTNTLGVYCDGEMVVDFRVDDADPLDCSPYTAKVLVT